MEIDFILCLMLVAFILVFTLGYYLNGSKNDKEK